MLDVMISFIYEINFDDYSFKYIELLKKSIETIYLTEYKFISLRLFENDLT